VSLSSKVPSLYIHFCYVKEVTFHISVPERKIVHVDGSVRQLFILKTIHFKS